MTAAPEATTIDDFLGGRLRVEQPARGFRAGLDAVLLAAALTPASLTPAPGRRLRVLDAGAGVGTAGLCAAVRVADADITLVERAATLAELARRNVARNDLSGRATVVEIDILAAAAAHEAAGLHAGSYDHVIANPPYLENGRHSLPADAVAAAAFGMAEGTLDQWLRFLARMATADGRLVLIHRADALGEVLAAIGARFGALRILPLHPRAGDPAHRIIVSGRKGSRAPLQLLPGLVLHGAGNEFLPAVGAVLRDGEALEALVEEP